MGRKEVVIHRINELKKTQKEMNDKLDILAEKQKDPRLSLQKSIYKFQKTLTEMYAKNIEVTTDKEILENWRKIKPSRLLRKQLKHFGFDVTLIRLKQLGKQKSFWSKTKT